MTAFFDWSKLSDAEILKLRICDLKLSLEQSEIFSWIQNYFEELKNRGITLKPKIYLGDEWFSPEGVAAIAIPFYLAHPRLRALEKSMMFEAEGEDPEYFTMLLRHETGHALDHAYGFSKTKDFKKIFGNPSEEYHPETYRPKPYSRQFVLHLDRWYAQSHPDEDFAETFAVWMNPNSDWAMVYADWPGALKKLKYMDALMRSIQEKPPRIKGGRLMSEASRLKTTLEHYYQRRRKENADEYPDFYDKDLIKIFDGKKTSAAQFLKKNRKMIVDSVDTWSGEKKYVINELVRKFMDRSRSLELKLDDEAKAFLQVGAYLTAQVSHHLFTGKFKRTV